MILDSADSRKPSKHHRKSILITMKIIKWQSAITANKVKDEKLESHWHDAEQIYLWRYMLQ